MVPPRRPGRLGPRRPPRFGHLCVGVGPWSANRPPRSPPPHHHHHQPSTTLPDHTIAHPSAKYGIPLSVALRPAFGHLGARLPGLLSALLALPWCAWLLLLAAHALTAGIARVSAAAPPPAILPFPIPPRSPPPPPTQKPTKKFKPEAEAWAPLPPEYLPRGHTSLLSLLALLASGLALWLWYVFGRQQGCGGAGAGTAAGARGFAPTAAATLLGLYVGTAVWLGRTVGVEESLAVRFFFLGGGGVACLSSLVLGVGGM